MLSDYAENNALSDIEERSPEQEDLARIALAKHLSDLPIDVVGKNFFGDSRFVFTVFKKYIQVD
jgi:hypothetical protein